jgi:hypothetical protein
MLRTRTSKLYTQIKASVCKGYARRCKSLNIALNFLLIMAKTNTYKKELKNCPFRKAVCTADLCMAWNSQTEECKLMR